MMLQYAPANHWLKQPRLTQNRIRIWTNLKRIVLALEKLHLQGLLHRNLDTWAILTAGSEDPDFQLTGFEWSIRVVAVDDAKDRRGRLRPTPEKYDSFRRDWSALGWIASYLLGVSREKLTDLSLVPSEVADHLEATEVRVLRNLISIEPLLRLDGEVIAGAIDELIGDLGAEAAGRDAKRIIPQLEPQQHSIFVAGGFIGADRLNRKCIGGGKCHLEHLRKRQRPAESGLCRHWLYLGFKPAPQLIPTCELAPQARIALGRGSGGEQIQ